jgi:hypothetical protein
MTVNCALAECGWDNLRMLVDAVYLAGLALALLAGVLTGRALVIVLPLAGTVIAFLAGYVVDPGDDDWGTWPQIVAVYFGVPMTLLAATGIALNRLIVWLPGRDASA